MFGQDNIKSFDARSLFWWKGKSRTDSFWWRSIRTSLRCSFAYHRPTACHQLRKLSTCKRQNQTKKLSFPFRNLFSPLNFYCLSQTHILNIDDNQWTPPLVNTDISPRSMLIEATCCLNVDTCSSLLLLLLFIIIIIIIIIYYYYYSIQCLSCRDRSGICHLACALGSKDGVSMLSHLAPVLLEEVNEIWVPHWIQLHACNLIQVIWTLTCRGLTQTHFNNCVAWKKLSPITTQLWSPWHVLKASLGFLSLNPLVVGKDKHFWTWWRMLFQVLLGWQSVSGKGCLQREATSAPECTAHIFNLPEHTRYFHAFGTHLKVMGRCDFSAVWFSNCGSLSLNTDLRLSLEPNSLLL